MSRPGASGPDVWPVMHSIAAAGNRGDSGTSRPHRTSAKTRLMWTAELQHKFDKAVRDLGGPHKAVPNKILQLMSIKGLTRDHVSSHLQKHRIRIMDSHSDAATHPPSSRGQSSSTQSSSSTTSTPRSQSTHQQDTPCRHQYGQHVHGLSAAVMAHNNQFAQGVPAQPAVLGMPRSTQAASYTSPCMQKVASGRLLWTVELHACFVAAVNQLGGADVATPNDILLTMNVPGLSRENVKSHLQKYRQTVKGLQMGPGHQCRHNRHHVNVRRVQGHDMHKLQPQPQHKWQPGDTKVADTHYLQSVQLWIEKYHSADCCTHTTGNTQIQKPLQCLHTDIEATQYYTIAAPSSPLSEEKPVSRQQPAVKDELNDLGQAAAELQGILSTAPSSTDSVVAALIAAVQPLDRSTQVKLAAVLHMIDQQGVHGSDSSRDPASNLDSPRPSLCSTGQHGEEAAMQQRCQTAEQHVQDDEHTQAYSGGATPTRRGQQLPPSSSCAPSLQACSESQPSDEVCHPDPWKLLQKCMQSYSRVSVRKGTTSASASCTMACPQQLALQAKHSLGSTVGVPEEAAATLLRHGDKQVEPLCQAAPVVPADLVTPHDSTHTQIAGAEALQHTWDQQSAGTLAPIKRCSSDSMLLHQSPKKLKLSEAPSVSQPLHHLKPQTCGQAWTMAGHAECGRDSSLPLSAAEQDTIKPTCSDSTTSSTVLEQHTVLLKSI